MYIVLCLFLFVILIYILSVEKCKLGSAALSFSLQKKETLLVKKCHDLLLLSLFFFFRFLFHRDVWAEFKKRNYLTSDL